MDKENNWTRQLQDALKRVSSELFRNSWHYDSANDRGFSAEICWFAEMEENAALQIVETSIHEQQLKVYATVDKSITSVAEVQRLVHRVLSLINEDFFLFVPVHDAEALRFWFMAGTANHGHTGEVVIKREHISHVDVSVLDTSSRS